MYVIKLDQGDYYQTRGGYDWGRANFSEATLFDTPEEAEAVIAAKLRGFCASVAPME